MSDTTVRLQPPDSPPIIPGQGNWGEYKAGGAQESGAPSTPAPAPSGITQPGGLGLGEQPAEEITTNPAVDAVSAAELEQRALARQNELKAIREGMADRPPIPEAPPVRPLPPPPQFNPVDFVGSFGQTAVAFAVLASALSRRPMINALQGMAAAINGIHDGNIERFNLGMKQWKAETENALETSRLEQQRYADIIRGRAVLNQDDIAKLRTIAAEQQDDKILALLRRGEISQAFQLMRDRERARSQMEIQKLRIEANAAREEAKPINILRNAVRKNFQAVYGRDMLPQEEEVQVKELSAPASVRMDRENLYNQAVATLQEIDRAARILNRAIEDKKNVVGIPGRISSMLSAVGSGIDSYLGTNLAGHQPVHDFRQAIEQVKHTYNSLTHLNGRLGTGNMKSLDDIVPGLSAEATPEAAKKGLESLYRYLISVMPRPLGLMPGATFKFKVNPDTGTVYPGWFVIDHTGREIQVR